MNEKFAHTAGPWNVGTSSENGVHCVDAIDPHRPGIIEICEVWGTYADTEKDDMSLANAHLIAAAPTMLEALHAAEEALVNSRPMMDHYPEAVARHDQALLSVSAAIAKALGKTSEAA